MFKTYRFLKNYKKHVIIGPIFKLIEAGLELLLPLVMAKIIDVGAKNNDVTYILTMGGLMLLLGLVGLACSITCQYNAALASQGFGTELRNKLFRHINSFTHRELDKIGIESLITRMTNDTNQLQLSVAMLIRLVIRVPFLIIGATVISFFIDARLALIFLITIPLIALVLFLVMTKSIPLYKKVQTQLDKIALVTRESLTGTRVIRAFARQKSEKDRFECETEELKENAVRVGRLSALLNPITYVIMNVAIIAIVWFGGYHVNSGSLMQGQIIALIQYMSQILIALVIVANLVVLFTKSAACDKRVSEVFDIKQSITDDGNSIVSSDMSAPAIEFCNVSFSYGALGDNALENLNVTIKRAQTVGIIGGTGSGKTTLINLIARFYDPTDGVVRLNGVDIKRYPFKQLRKIISVVSQKAELFSGTIEQNLRWRDENATMEELKSVTEISQASEFIEKLTDGYQHKILQGGKNLSGGQKQRISIARGLMGSPEILILDDSSSALDFKTDANFRKALLEKFQDTTVIMVSQRASVIKNADQIIVLDDGNVMGIGSHDALMQSCEVYREICLSQQGNTEETK